MKYVKIEGDTKLSQFITPMSATLSDEPPFDDTKWLFEIKWDGYRAMPNWMEKVLGFIPAMDSRSLKHILKFTAS